MAFTPRIIAILLLLPLLGGCKEGSFLQRRFDNFTAHYNTFYNAKRSYWMGVDALERVEQPVDQDRYIQVFLAQEQASRSQEFEAAIEKAADILRDHPRSRWFDDALMLIGKSYFYRQEYVGAEQKFRETINLGGPLADEARFWLARTLVAAKAFEDAKVHLSETLAMEDLDNRWEGLLRLVQGELYVQEEEWETAADELAAGLDLARDREIESRAQFLLGQVFETIGDYPAASEAYDNVRHFNPLYELSYAAQVSQIRTLGFSGDYEQAFNLLRRMRRDDKNTSYLPQLELLEARVLTMAGSNDEAFEIFDRLLYDPISKVPAVKGRAHYHFAELYRDGYGDFFLAATHFDTAATSIRTNRGMTELQTPYAIQNAREVADTFLNFREVAERILHADSLLELGRLDSVAFEQRIEEIEEIRQEEARRRAAELARRLAENRFRNAGSGGGTQQRQTASNASGGEYGFLNFKDPVRFQEGIAAFRESWGDRPRVDNWRRQEAINASMALAEESGDGDGNGARQAMRELELMMPPLDLAEVPRDSASQQQMIDDQAAARYELANILFLSMNLPDSAASWYRLVIEENSGLEVAERAYFALAEIQLALGDPAAAERIYERIVTDHPDTDFAVRARERLGLPELETAPDSLQLAQTAYDEYYLLWDDYEYEAAFEGMIEVALKYPTVTVAGKALVAAGLIYAQAIEADPEYLAAEIPVREGLLPPLPDSLQHILDALENDSVIVQVDSLDSVADSIQTADYQLTAAETEPRTPSVTDSTQVVEAIVETPTDSVVSLAADSLAGVAAVMPDSSMTAVPDPVARMDSTARVSGIADSAAVIKTAPADTVLPFVMPEVVYLGEVVPWPLTVENLYESVRLHFPGTTYASRASELLSYLQELQTPPEPAMPDSTAALAALARPDSLRSESSIADSLRSQTITGSALATPRAMPPDSSAGMVPAAVSDSAGGEMLFPEGPTPGEAVDSPAGRPEDLEDQEARDRLDALRRRRDQLQRREQGGTTAPPDTTTSSGGGAR